MNKDRRQWRLEFGARLAQARIDAGLTQSELARKVGMHANMVGSYEQGAHEPTANALARLCGETGASADAVLGLEARWPNATPFDEGIIREEIVRCGDCKFGTPSGGFDYVNCLFDKENMRTFSDFCSKGIRKEDDDGR